MAPLLGGPHQLEAVNSLEGEHDNLRAALEFASSHDPEKGLRMLEALWLFWFMHSHFVEGRRWTERLLQASEGLAIPDLVLSHALVALCSFTYFQGEPETSIKAAMQGLELARHAGDRLGELLHLHHLGLSHYSLGNTQAAIETLEEGIRLGRTLPESNVLGWLIHDLALTYHGQGELEKAEIFYLQGVELSRRLGERWGLAYVYGNLADIAIQRGKFEQAEALLEESVPIFIQFGDQHGYSGSQLHLAKFAWLRGDMLQAGTLLNESLDIERHLGRMRYVSSSIEELADFMAGNNGAHSAAILLGSADAYRRSEGYAPEPEEAQIRDHATNLAIIALGGEAYKSAYAQGERLTIEQAIDRVFLPLSPGYN